jgi:hypothetical protein
MLVQSGPLNRLSNCSLALGCLPRSPAEAEDTAALRSRAMTGTAAVPHTWRGFWVMDAVPYGCAPAVGVEVAIGLFALERRQKGGWPPALRRTPRGRVTVAFHLAALAASPYG